MRKFLLSSRTPPDESLLGRLAVFAAAGVANLALALAAGAQLTAITCVGVVALGHYVSWRGRLRPRSWRGQLLLGTLVMACVTYLFLDLTFGLFGGALPQAKFAVIAQAVTSFDLKSRRNLFSHLWHSLVILYVAALFAWTAAFLPLVMLWAGCMWAFLHYSRTPTEAREMPPVAGWLRLLRQRAAARWGRALPWAAAWLIASGLFFVALPRFAGRPIAVPLLVSIPLQQESTTEVLPAVLPLVGTNPGSQLSGAINLRVRGRLGDEVVLRVRAPAPSYWRAYVLEQYRGQSWQRTGHPGKALPPISTHIEIADENTSTGSGLPQTFYIERPIANEVLVSYPARELYFPARGLALADTGTIRAPYQLRPGVNYAAVSRVRDLSPASLRRATPLDAGTLASHPVDLDLPAGIPARVKQLSDRLVTGKTTEYDRVAAVTRYLQTHYRYSLDTPRLPAGHDAVDEFLFVDHVGFCEQFASALAVTLREEKVPARLAVGYSTGEPNSFTGSFTVRAKDAHAWVEVLFPGIGWVPFDASPGFDSEPIAHNPARWFLSDVSTSIPIFSHVNLGQSAASLAVVIPALALVLFLGLVVRRRRVLSPELRAYLAAQRWLQITGLPIRRASQTPREHLAALAISQPDVAAVLRPLVRALEAAVYGRRREPTMARASAIASRALRWRLRGLRSDRR